MTLPQVVQDAVNSVLIALNDWTATYASEFCCEEDVKSAHKRISARGTLGYICGTMSALDTIRAELHRLTEIAEGVEPLVIRLHDVTTRLEAANALLEKVKAWDVAEATRNFRLSDNGVIFFLPEQLREAIQSHLLGAGDEG